MSGEVFGIIHDGLIGRGDSGFQVVSFAEIKLSKLFDVGHGMLRNQVQRIGIQAQDGAAIEPHDRGFGEF